MHARRQGCRLGQLGTVYGAAAVQEKHKRSAGHMVATFDNIRRQTHRNSVATFQCVNALRTAPLFLVQRPFLGRLIAQGPSDPPIVSFRVVPAGPRSVAMRKRLNELLQNACGPADEFEVEKLKLARGPQEALPENFYKLTRTSFLLILCKELARINSRIRSYAEKRFQGMDVTHSGMVEVRSVQDFIAEAADAVKASAAAQEACNLFVQTADAATLDKLPDQINAASVSQLAQEGFAQVKCKNRPIRRTVVIDVNASWLRLLGWCVDEGWKRSALNQQPYPAVATCLLRPASAPTTDLSVFQQLSMVQQISFIDPNQALKAGRCKELNMSAVWFQRDNGLTRPPGPFAHRPASRWPWSGTSSSWLTYRRPRCSPKKTSPQYSSRLSRSSPRAIVSNS